ncbi:unnamed protein product [Porites lobata]|uniref:Uncharacterized protein n=1 Tax=Porites lobata TaxID=104759 RepID=A0ABN8MVN1_9CNID|nr:unnamed protein product [Porites lobata]
MGTLNNVDSAPGAFASNDEGAVICIPVSFSDLSGGLVTVTSAVTSAVPPHNPATPLTPMMSR